MKIQTILKFLCYLGLAFGPILLNASNQTLKYGDSYYLKNLHYQGSYLDACGLASCGNGTKYAVITHSQPNRDGYKTGTWIVLSVTGKSIGTPVLVGDVVYLKNVYNGGTYLDTCGPGGGCDKGTKYNVTTNTSANRVNHKTSHWQIVAATGASNGSPVNTNQTIHLKNLYGQGSYLDCCGLASCGQGAKYKVSTNASANRANQKTGHWAFQAIPNNNAQTGTTTSAPAEFPYRTEDKEAGSPFTNNGNPHPWIKQASKNWMGCLTNNTLLKDISIPGTHDSGARYGGLVAETQSWTITEQFEAGIRYFDIRCRPTKNAFAIHHGAYFQKQMFGDVMNEITAFLQNNPTEAVIMRLKSEHTPQEGSKSFQEIWDSYANQYQRYLYQGTNSNATLGSVRGKVYVMCQSGCAGYGMTYNSDTELQDRYKVYWLAHKQTKGTDWATLPSKKEEIKKYIDKAANSSKWVLNHLSGAIGMTPPHVARETNNDAYKYLGTKSGKRNLGIIIMDYPGEKLIYRILKSNFDFSERCNCPPETFRNISAKSWVEFRLPQGKGNQSIFIKGGAYNKFSGFKCNRVYWSDLQFSCNPNSCKWERVSGKWDADAFCHGSKGNSPYVFTGNK
ncbi:MAG: phosphatidylinositol-specific phospholipase C domain-containing protein [Saprospiraceae bacterium]